MNTPVNKPVKKQQKRGKRVVEIQWMLPGFTPIPPVIRGLNVVYHLARPRVAQLSTLSTAHKNSTGCKR